MVFGEDVPAFYEVCRWLMAVPDHLDLISALSGQGFMGRLLTIVRLSLQKEWPFRLF